VSVTPSVINGNDNGTSNVSGASKTSAGSIVGIVIGVILGVGALIIIAGFIRRRMRRNPRNRYGRDSFMRQSVALPDDAPAPMIGTRNALALARANMGYGDASPAASPQMTEQYGGASPYYPDNSGYATHAYAPSPGYDPTQLTRRPSTGTPVSAGGRYPTTPMDQYPYENAAPIHNHESYDQGGANESRGQVVSVTPFQQQQYAEISRQLNYPPIAHIAESNGHDGHADAASPFSDPAGVQPAANPGLGRSLSTTYGSLSATTPTPSQPTRSGTPVDANPQQTFTMPSGGPGITYPALNGARNVQVQQNDDSHHHGHAAPVVNGNDRLNTPYGGPVRTNISRETVYDVDDAYGGI